MSVTAVGNNVAGTDYQQYQKSDEVKTIFKEYVYHAFGRPEETQEHAETADDVKVVGTSMSNYEKQRFTGWLSGLYEYFSRANTRNACEEMQKLFQETANELTEEFGTESVDFAYVEQHTRFTLDGGITFNGVWDSMEWQINRDRAIGGNFHDVNMAPPEDFVYCSNATWDGEAGLDGFKEYFAGKNAESPFKLFLLAAVKNIDAKESLLLNHENYMAASEWEDNDIYQSTMSFLKNFNITWNYGSNRFEFLSVKQIVRIEENMIHNTTRNSAYNDSFVCEKTHSQLKDWMQMEMHMSKRQMPARLIQTSAVLMS